MNRLQWKMLALIVLVAGIAGCRSMTPAVSYYILRPVDANASPATAAAVATVRTVSVQPVQLPNSVNRIQMVRRKDSNRLEISAFHRWADYPDRLVQQVMETNLQVLASGIRVVHHPWPVGLQPDVTVYVQLREWNGTTDNMMVMHAEWTVIPTENPAAQQSGRAMVSESIAGSGYDDLAAAHSRALAVLCQDLAQAIDTLE